MKWLYLILFLLCSISSNKLFGSCDETVYSRLQNLLTEARDDILEFTEITPQKFPVFRKTKMLSSKYSRFFKTGMKKSTALLGVGSDSFIRENTHRSKKNVVLFNLATVGTVPLLTATTTVVGTSTSTISLPIAAALDPILYLLKYEGEIENGIVLVRGMETSEQEEVTRTDACENILKLLG